MLPDGTMEGTKDESSSFCKWTVRLAAMLSAGLKEVRISQRCQYIHHWEFPPGAPAKGHLKRDFLVRQSYNFSTARECTITLSCFLGWFTLESIRLKMYAHLARCSGRTPAKWDLFTLRNISQQEPGTHWAFHIHVFRTFFFFIYSHSYLYVKSLMWSMGNSMQGSVGVCDLPMADVF